MPMFDREINVLDGIQIDQVLISIGTRSHQQLFKKILFVHFLSSITLPDMYLRAILPIETENEFSSEGVFAAVTVRFVQRLHYLDLFFTPNEFARQDGRF